MTVAAARAAGFLPAANVSTADAGATIENSEVNVTADKAADAPRLINRLARVGFRANRTLSRHRRMTEFDPKRT
jgi:hypothetical protein